jgi:DNA-binding response OmpR family regulator
MEVNRMLGQNEIYENLLEKKILLVDDEKDIGDLLEKVLKKDGFKNILKASSGQEAIYLCKRHQPDAIVLDIMLPDIDGIEVCKKIREFSYCPIMFLSSKNDDIDKILGLSSGGDDYITKPFSPREIVFRIKAQLRRQQYDCSNKNNVKQQIISNNLKIDTDGCRVFKNDIELEFTAREFGLLRYLAENPNKIISKERLYEQVWGEDSVGCGNTVMVHIRHIREKIEDDPTNPKLLQTVKGLGYRLVKRDS